MGDVHNAAEPHHRHIVAREATCGDDVHHDTSCCDDVMSPWHDQHVHMTPTCLITFDDVTHYPTSWSIFRHRYVCVGLPMVKTYYVDLTMDLSSCGITQQRSTIWAITIIMWCRRRYFTVSGWRMMWISDDDSRVLRFNCIWSMIVFMMCIYMIYLCIYMIYLYLSYIVMEGEHREPVVDMMWTQHNG